MPILENVGSNVHYVGADGSLPVSIGPTSMGISNKHTYAMNGRLQRISSSGSLWIAASVLVGVLLLSAGCAPQEEQPAPQPPVAEAAEVSGRALYETYCMSCHGPEGKGDGPVAAALQPTPPDLTQLEEKYDGFPEEKVYQTIDGRADVQAHGTRQMPVWGNIWYDVEGENLSDEQMQKRISALVSYLESIQVEGGPMSE